MRYLTVEFQRSFLSRRFIIAVLGIFFTYFISLYKISGINTSVYTTYASARYFIPVILSLTFCALCYSQCFCEDMEYHYIYQICLRSKMKHYVVAKVILISITSIAIMVFGTIVFILIIRTRVPWVLEGEWTDSDILATIFLQNKIYILYFMFHSFYWGILSAITSLLSAYVSLFWKNRLLIISTPFMAYFLWIYYFRQIFKDMRLFDLSLIFNPSLNVCKNARETLIWPFCLGGGIIVLFGICIYRRMRRIYGV